MTYVGHINNLLFLGYDQIKTNYDTRFIIIILFLLIYVNIYLFSH